MKRMAVGRATLAIVALSLLVLSGLVYPQVMAASTSTSTTTSTAQVQGSAPESLLVSVVPPKLPADGGSYPAIVVSLQSSAGKASLALNDTVVFLTSSQEGVGIVSSQVTIAKGAGFAVANFTTSTTPGTTTISASSVGLTAVSTTVTTVNPSGFAARLKIIPVPGSQLVNPGGTGTLLVETLDSAGFPAKTSSDITVTLSSSNNKVASLPTNSLTLSSGSVLSSVNYTLGVSPGTATFTGSASGFNSGSGTVTVEGPSPFALKILAEPNPMPTSTSGRLVVTLTDPAGNPARAPSPIAVAISSSNTTIISIDGTTTIGAGQIYSVALFSSGSFPGTANLTASSPGLKSDFTVVTVSSPSLAQKLKLIVAPNPVLADGDSYDAIVVTLTDASGNPAVAYSDNSVTLTSSNSAVGSVSATVDIPEGSDYAVATFSSTFFVGSTFITALAQNLQSATATVNSYGPIPTQVVAQALPSNLPADGGQYQALEVMVEDASGLPAVAPVDIPVQLASSSTDVAMVNSSVVIKAGQSYVLTDVVTTISPGVANITVTSSGFSSSSTGFTTTRPAPSQLGFFVAPVSGIQSLGRGGDAILAIQLQDSNSSPARARQDTPIVVTSSNSSVIAKPILLDIAPGDDYAWAVLNTSAPGSTVLTASTSGLGSASASLSELSLPVTVSLTSSAPVISTSGTATLQLQVLVMGSPLGGANVTFTSTSGTMLSARGVTNPSGQFTDTFIPQQNGVATITATVQDPIIGNLTAGTDVLVTSPGALGTGGSTPIAGGLGILGTILPILIVVVIIVIVVLGSRRVVRRRRASAEEGRDDAPEAA